jgi:hypothetical protein
MNDSDLKRRHEQHVERVMSEARSRGVQYKNPNKVAYDIMTRAVDPKTGRVYKGSDGLRLQEIKKQEAISKGWNPAQDRSNEERNRRK